MFDLEKSQTMVYLLTSVFHTHLPTWDNCQKLLLTLFNIEKHLHVLGRAQIWLVFITVIDIDACVNATFPECVQAVTLIKHRVVRPYINIILLFWQNSKKEGEIL